MATVPSIPTIYTQPFASDQTLEFNWQPPVSDGGSAILDYRLQINPGAISQTYPATARYATITGLDNTVLYSATLEARNAIGYSPAIAFRPFQPGTAPLYGVSTATVNWVSSTTALLSWTPPVAQPTSKLYWYVIEGLSSGTVVNSQRYTASALSRSNYFITGLDPSTTYGFNVYGVNCPDWSPPTSTNTLYFHPSSIPNLSLWLDASDPATIETKSGQVVRWMDKSGFNKYASTLNGTISYSTIVQNGLNAVSFDATSRMQSFINFESSTLSAFWSGSPSSTSPAVARMLALAPSGTSDYGTPNYAGILFKYTNLLGALRNTTVQTSGPFFPTDQWHIADGFQIPGTQSVGLNGSNLVSQATGVTSGMSCSQIIIGVNPANDTEQFIGKMGEILVYASSLTTAQQQKVEGYLAWKWGTQNKLPPSHPYYSTPPS